MFHSSLLLSIILLFSFFLKVPLALAAERQNKESLASEWMLVDDSSSTPNSSGTVSEIFLSSHHPVTVDQWACFMNSVYVDPENKNDFRGLYHPEMFDDQNTTSLLQISITKKTDRSGSQRKWTYSARSIRSGFFWTAVTNDGSSPIANITLDDEKRYCNWCEHGSPHAATLEEALAMTEKGVYDLADEQEEEVVHESFSTAASAIQSNGETKVPTASDQGKVEVFSRSASVEKVSSTSNEIKPASGQNSFYSFLESLWNVTYSQIATNLIEIAMNAFSLEEPPVLGSREEDETLFSWISNKLFPFGWEYRIKSLKPFTYSRIAMNCFFSLITAAGISTEVTPYLKDDSLESICLTIAETMAVMVLIETGAFVLEYPTAWLGYYFFDEEAGVTAAKALTKAIKMVADGLTWNRLFLNVVYIGLNTYLSVSSTLQDYEKQHARS